MLNPPSTFKLMKRPRTDAVSALSLSFLATSVNLAKLPTRCRLSVLMVWRSSPRYSPFSTTTLDATANCDQSHRFPSVEVLHAARLATHVSTGAIAVVFGSRPVENSRLCAAMY
jgi:hypothetical protein